MELESALVEHPAVVEAAVVEHPAVVEAAVVERLKKQYEETDG